MVLFIFKLPFPNGFYRNGVCRALWAWSDASLPEKNLLLRASDVVPSSVEGMNHENDTTFNLKNYSKVTTFMLSQKYFTSRY